MAIKEQNIRNSHVISDPKTHTKYFHANDPFALIQYIGYIKHLSHQNGGKVVFRGQRKDYQSLKPSLFRNLATTRNTGKYKGELNKLIQHYKQSCGILSTLDDDVVEALLQHYGINTTWIDGVDNIWVSLWFACHRWIKDTRDGWIGHYIQRNPEGSKGKVKGIFPNDYLFDESDWAYIYVIEINDQCEYLDLREQVPSIFVRPHMQHGVLFRMKGDTKDRPLDYFSTVTAIIRVSLKDALTWLGNGNLVNRDYLFPSSYYDSGYNILIENFIPTSFPDVIGKIQIHTNGKL